MSDVRAVVTMATRAASAPAGRVLEVFASSAERQGAYDFLANESFSPRLVTSALSASTASKCAQLSMVLVSVDGSSLSLVDRTGRKGFGTVGSTSHGGRGLKVADEELSRAAPSTFR